MPMPRSFRALGRVLNPVIMLMAKRFRPFAVVCHRGRVTGRDYRNPVMAFPVTQGWIVALAYGSDVQWRRNLDAAHGGELIRQGTRRRIADPEALSGPEALPLLPGWARAMFRMVRVGEYLLLVEDPRPATTV